MRRITTLVLAVGLIFVTRHAFGEATPDKYILAKDRPQALSLRLMEGLGLPNANLAARGRNYYLWRIYQDGERKLGHADPHDVELDELHCEIITANWGPLSKTTPLDVPVPPAPLEPGSTYHFALQAKSEPAAPPSYTLEAAANPYRVRNSVILLLFEKQLHSEIRCTKYSREPEAITMGELRAAFGDLALVDRVNDLDGASLRKRPPLYPEAKLFDKLSERITDIAKQEREANLKNVEESRSGHYLGRDVSPGQRAVE